MAHPEQMRFCLSIKERFPKHFKSPRVLDVGSLDINGNNRYLFEGKYKYIGVDLGEGPNVDVVAKGHEYSSEKQFDIVISTECFEHDMYWKETIMNCVRLTKPGGIFMFTCATTGRHEHGTHLSKPQDSPFTTTYYRNLTENNILSIEGFSESFIEYEFSTNNNTKDLYFYGVKK